MIGTCLRLLFRHLRHLANVLRSTTLPDTGIITGPNRSLFFSSIHFHIFGLFFPVIVPHISAAVSIVLDLYRSVNLTGQVVAPVRSGNDVTAIRWSRDHGNGDVMMSAQHWPEVFKQDSETLQR